MTHGRIRALANGVRDAHARLRVGEERGAVMVISAMVIVAIIGIAALAIDVGSFYQDQRQVQGAADSAALFGADDLAGGASAATVTSDVNASVAKNAPGATPAITISGNTITVKVSNTTPSFFGRIYNGGSPAVSARAVASGTSTATGCTATSQSAGKCDVVFAMDNNCAAGHYSVTATAGSINMTGVVHSNGSTQDSSGGSTWYYAENGPAANGCTTAYNSNQETITNGPFSVAAQPWPIDFSRQYPACSASGPILCTGPHGTPSYCTYAAPSYSVVASPTPAIYCAYGTATIAQSADPANFNGTVSFDQGGFAINASYIAGNVTWTRGTGNITAYNYPTNQMLFYATGTGTAVNFAAGGYSITGDSFAPNGAIATTAGINSSTLFLEAQDVYLGAGGYTGDGPVAASAGGTTSTSASLTQ